MFNSYCEGFLLGLGAAVPIGAINILIMNHALKSYRSAVAIGAGAMSADVFYLLLILLGLTPFFEYPWVSNTLGILGSLFLGYMAYLVFKGRNKSLEKEEVHTSKRTLFKNYLKGFLLTSVNPYTVAFWLSVAGYVVNQKLDFTYTILGLLSAILLWITLMPYFVYRSRHRISQKIAYYISVISTLILGFFAVSLLLSLMPLASR
jgi:L-lysine exporter family protein LysE/ArgO